MARPWVRFTGVPDFEQQLIKFSDAIQVAVEDSARKMAFDIFRGVTTRTPVDTGWARASWNIAFHSPDLTVPPKPGESAGRAASESAAKARNDEESGKLDGDLSALPVIWISNALPYIVPLENGHSKQAGKGFMVQRTLADVIREFQNTSRGFFS